MDKQNNIIIPKEYELRYFLDDLTQTTLFIFSIINIITIKEKICIRGYVYLNEKKQIVTLWHSKKLLKWFNSNRGKKICLYGKFSADFVSFFPQIKPPIEGIFPIYNCNKKSYIKSITNFISTIDDYILQKILTMIHKPQNIHDVHLGLTKLMQIEVAIFLHRIKHTFRQTCIKKFTTSHLMLPFNLNKSQEIALNEILSDFIKPYRSIRLLYGDVGSGKTIVALIAAFNIISNGGIVYYLVPTTVLAKQVYNIFSTIITDYKIGLITGDSKDIECNVYIGTQALFFRTVPDNLRLLIIDEQHRFGVIQRLKLVGDNVDLLMLTATPIPRTLSMITRGYINISTLDTNLSHKLRSIEIYNTSELDSLLQKCIEIAKTERVIWICKSVNELDNIYKYMNKYLDYTQCIKIHGALQNKDELLNIFSNLNAGVLVSTTVIEVGIDIDVNYIFIQDADYFGFAQLHQLRGRICRRNQTGICYLIGTNMEKLNKVKIAETGIEIAKLDLEERGAGDLSGLEQSGFRGFNYIKQLDDKNRVIDKDITADIVELTLQKKEIIIGSLKESTLDMFQIDEMIGY